MAPTTDRPLSDGTTPERPAAELAAELAAAEAREADLRAAHEFYAAELEHDRAAELRRGLVAEPHSSER